MVGMLGLCQRRKPTELAYSFLYCSCVYFCLTALSTVFHFINFPDHCPFFTLFFRSCLSPMDPFNYMSLYKVSLSPDLIPSGLTGLKTPIN